MAVLVARETLNGVRHGVALSLCSRLAALSVPRVPLNWIIATIRLTQLLAIWK